MIPETKQLSKWELSAQKTYYTKNSKILIAKGTAKRRLKALAGTYHCVDCQKNYASSYSLKRHYKSKTHQFIINKK